MEFLWLVQAVLALLFASSLVSFLLFYWTKKRGWLIAAGGLLVLGTIIFAWG